MQFDAALFFCALGLALVLEACLYTLFPEKMQTMLKQMTQMPPSTLRRYGLGGLCLGLAIIWLARW